MKLTKKLTLAALIVCLLLVLAACSQTEPEVQEELPNNEAPELGYEAEESHFPVEIITFNFEGEEVVTVFERAPERVVAVYQGSIETMIALGLEDHVIASFGLDNEVRPEWQASLARMNYDDSVFAPDRETVMMLDPDLIFSWGSLFSDTNLGDVGYWHNSGVNTYINSNTRRGGHPRTVENEFADILNIGRIFNVEYRAQALVAEMQAEIDAALAAAVGQEPPTVAIVEFISGTITNYTGTQLGGNMVERLGGVLAIPEGSPIGAEDLLAADPEIIFVVFMERDDVYYEDASIAQLMENPALASLQAVQNGRVYAIMLGDMFASAVRTLDGIRTFAQGLYPHLGY